MKSFEREGTNPGFPNTLKPPPADAHELLLEWLRQCEARTETAYVRIITPGGGSLLRILIHQGRICFGVELHGKPYLDRAFRDSHPDLTETLATFFRTQWTQVPSEERFLLPHDALILGEGVRTILRVFLAQLFLGCARAALGHAAIELLFEPTDAPKTTPLSFSPRDLAFALTRKPSPEDSSVLELHRKHRDRALGAWLFHRNQTHTSLRDLIEHPPDASLPELSSLLSSIKHLPLTYESAPCQASYFVTEDQEFWAVALDDHVVSLQRHSLRYFGLILPTLTRHGDHRGHP